MAANENIIISDEHRPHLARLQHIAEFFSAERARLEAEMRYVMQAGARAHAELTAFLQQAYGVDAQQSGVQLDADAGRISVPHIEPPTAPAAPATTPPPPPSAEAE